MLIALFLGTTVMVSAATIPAKQTTQNENVVLKHKKVKTTHKARKEEVKKVESTKK